LAIFGPFRGIFGQICGKFNFFCGSVGVAGLAFRMYGWGINKKWIKAESSEDDIYIHFLDEEKCQVSDSVTAVHLTMFVV